MAKMGRPIKFTEEKIRQFEKLCRLNPSLEDASIVLEISATTIDEFCRKNNTTFREFRAKHMAHTRLRLVQKALDMASNGNTAMMIFCLKNLCKWSDNARPDEDAGAIQIRYEVVHNAKIITPEIEPAD